MTSGGAELPGQVGHDIDGTQWRLDGASSESCIRLSVICLFETGWMGAILPSFPQQCGVDSIRFVPSPDNVAGRSPFAVGPSRAPLPTPSPDPSCDIRIDN